MGKIKTIKAVTKRVRVTKTKKVLKKTAGQDHFNSHESGNTTRAKRGLKSLGKQNCKNVKRFLPYA